MQRQFIEITGAREHNLKNVSLQIPKRTVTVFTSVSGSGKSSLVFDTIAAEAQRQLNETFTTFIRNRLPKYGQPDIDAIENLSAAVIVSQKRIGGNARSTVGTITDIYSLLRLLFSRAGEPHIGESNAFSFNDPAGMCPRCSGLGRVITPTRFSTSTARCRTVRSCCPGLATDSGFTASTPTSACSTPPLRSAPGRRNSGRR